MGEQENVPSGTVKKIAKDELVMAVCTSRERQMSIQFVSSPPASDAQALRQSFVCAFHQRMDTSRTPAEPTGSQKPRARVCVTASVVETAGEEGFFHVACEF